MDMSSKFYSGPEHKQLGLTVYVQYNYVVFGVYDDNANFVINLNQNISKSTIFSQTYFFLVSNPVKSIKFLTLSI